MLPFKWRLYKTFNYILLVIGSLFFVYIVFLFFSGPPFREGDIWLIPVLIGLLFFIMAIHSIINIVLVTKSFPDKVLTGNKILLNILSIIASCLSVTGLGIFIMGGMISEFEDDSRYESSDRDQTGKLMLLCLFLLWLVDLFVLVCQFSVSSFLKKNSKNSLTTMLDSIGKE